MIVWEWFQEPRSIKWEWFGPDSKRLAAQAATDTTAIVAVVGPAGQSGDGLSVLAAEALGGQRVVTINGFHAEPADTATVFGITRGAVSLGQTAQVQRFGEMTEGSWSWTPDGPLFIGASGTLTQTPPSGAVRRIGYALTSTSIFIDIQPTIAR